MVWFHACSFIAGRVEEQQARVYAVLTGVRPRAALRHHRGQAAQLPGVATGVPH